MTSTQGYGHGVRCRRKSEEHQSSREEEKKEISSSFRDAWAEGEGEEDGSTRAAPERNDAAFERSEEREILLNSKMWTDFQQV